MFRPRIIPVLLLRNQGLVKSIRFTHYQYIGDPINAVKIFNDLKADELVFLDILASRDGRTISLDFVSKVGEEANMPFSVGGGINSLQNIREIISAGAEKVVLNAAAAKNPDLIRQASETFGSSTIVVCMDVKKRFLGRNQVCISNATKFIDHSPIEYAQMVEEKGAGEIIVQSVDLDGTMKGYDIELIGRISENVTIPVIALGGAGGLNDLRNAYINGHANGLAAGSMFVYYGSRRGVLINYPDKAELKKIIQ